MNNYQRSLIKEHQQLVTNIEALTQQLIEFPQCINANEVNELIDVNFQMYYMKRYAESLVNRLLRTGIEVCDNNYYENVTKQVEEPVHIFGNDYDKDTAKVATSSTNNCKSNAK